MILIDYNQVAISSAMIFRDRLKNITDINEISNLITHSVLSTIKSLKKKFSNVYGDLVFCCESSKPWRVGFFSYYKEGRKTSRKKSEYDWSVVFSIVNQLKKDIKENFPYKVLEVESAEGDDIIAIIAKNFKDPFKTLICSKDKDFFQLHSDQIFQFDANSKKIFSESENSKDVLFEQIIRGDEIDGIPNILSDDDSFVNKKRQKSITKDFIEVCKNNGIPEQVLPNYRRNLILMDFNYIPESIKNKIIDAYVNCEIFGDFKTVKKYLLDRDLNKLFEDIGSFF